MPARLPRTPLARQIALSLAVKVAALIAMGVLLFGPDDRPPQTPAVVGEAVVGGNP